MKIKNRSPDIIKPFYRMPKELFINTKYAKLSIAAKALFGLVLDRASLSRQNNWIEEDKLYIILTINTVADYLNCGKDKAVEEMKELESVGLISKKRQGRGKPNLIFPNPSFLTVYGQKANKNSENQNSRILNNRIQEFGKTEPIKNNIKKTNSNNHPSIGDKLLEEERELVKEQIGYEYLIEITGEINIINLIVETITEVYCCNEDILFVIQGRKLNAQTVINQYQLLDVEHIHYVVDKLRDIRTKKKIANPKNYLISCLYEAPIIMEAEIENQIALDFGGSMPNKGYCM